MPSGLIITTPWMDKRVGNRSAVLVKEVSGPGINTELKARAACGIDRGSEFPDDANYICDNWDVTPLSIGLYRVAFAFSAGQGDRDNPLALPTRFIWSPTFVSEAHDRSADGFAIINSARDPFDPPPSRETTDIEFSVARWEALPFDPQKPVQYGGGVNDREFTILGHNILEGQGRCTRLGPLADYTMKSKWVEVGYSFLLRADGHDIRLLDQGTRGWIAGTGSRGGRGDPELSEIFYSTGDNAGNQINQPVRLNGKGKPIEPNLVGKDGAPLIEIGPPPGADTEEVFDGTSGKLLAVFLKYQRNKRVNFLSLGL